MKLQFSFTDREAAKILAALIAGEALLFVAYMLIHGGIVNIRWGPLRQAFNLNAEVSIPTWFSSMQYLVTGLLLLIASRNNQYREYISSFYLSVGGLLFLFMSLDESAALHEKMTTAAKSMKLNWMMINGHAAWVLVYAVIFVLLVGFGARPLYALWMRYRAEMLFGVLGAVVLVAGAVGVEIMSYQFMNVESQKAAYKLLVGIEESLEMLGESIVLYAVIRLTTRLSAPVAAPA